jgi:hypothetical protein
LKDGWFVLTVFFFALAYAASLSKFLKENKCPLRQAQGAILLSENFQFALAATLASPKNTNGLRVWF